MGEPVGLSNEEVRNRSFPPDPSTKGYIFQQTMYRIKDPKKSLEFYTKVLGMTLLQKCDFPEMKFSLYFMGYEDPKEIPINAKERLEWAFSRKATLELTHNWGTEINDDFSYHTGNTEPRGFGHIGIMVPDLNVACERMEKLSVPFVKKPSDGKMRAVAFIKDPDGYWIELFNAKGVADMISGSLYCEVLHIKRKEVEWFLQAITRPFSEPPSEDSDDSSPGSASRH